MPNIASYYHEFDKLAQRKYLKINVALDLENIENQGLKS